MLSLVITLNTMLILMINILNLKLIDHVRIWKCKNIFANGYAQI